MRVETRGWKRWAIAAGWALIVVVAAGFDLYLVSVPLNTVLGRFAEGGHVTSYVVGGDFTMYYTAARALRLNPHANIYSLATLRATYDGTCGQPPVTTYPYQPLLALLLEPVTLLPCSKALYLWWQLSFVLWAIITYWFARDATVRYGVGRGLLVGMLCLSFVPIWNGIEYGQIHLLILFIFVLSSRLVIRRLPQRAGIVLALGTVLKYFPAFILAYHLARGRWRLAGVAAAVCSALVLVELLFVGPATLFGSIHGATADVATYAALRRQWISNLPESKPFAWLLLLVALALPAAQTWRGQAVNDVLGEGWVLCAALLVAPLTWYHYLTWLLPLLIALFHATLNLTQTIPSGISWEAITRRLPLVGFAVALGMLLVPGQEEALAGSSLLLLWAVCGVLLLLDTRTENIEAASVLASAEAIEARDVLG